MKKETKEFLLGNSHIFDSTELDERQRAEAYKITFKLFVALIYTILFMSMFAFAYALFTENMTLLIACSSSMIVTELFIVLYAAMTSAKGAMNLEFARKTSSPSYAVSFVILTASMFFMSADRIEQGLNIKNISMLLYMFIYFIASLLLFYYSRRNMKVLEKQLKDDEENDE